jgi:alpha-tubulin suppressor-like RCC1 family protein
VETPGVSIRGVATGIIHTCALLSDSTVKCWGSNGAGQLGRGNTQDERNPVNAGPVAVTTNARDRVEQLVTGQVHTCVLLASNEVRCWGHNDSGQLGQGNSAWVGDDELPSSAPAVSVTADENIRILRLEAGPMNTCALLSNQHMKCWGKSNYGELGDGIAEQHVIGDDEVPSSVADTYLNTGAETVKQLVIGYHHMCMLLSNGTVKCWGRSDILGYGTSAPQLPVPAGYAAVVSIAPPGTFVTALSAGWFHTCALISDGSVRCWGVNVIGQMGLSHTSSIGDDELPSDVSPIQLTNVPGVTAVALSSGQGNHTCALLSDGTTKCWGQGSSGQLGDTNRNDIGDDETPASIDAIGF